MSVETVILFSPLCIVCILIKTRTKLTYARSAQAREANGCAQAREVNVPLTLFLPIVESLEDLYCGILYWNNVESLP
jgi:hypothetical protein